MSYETPSLQSSADSLFKDKVRKLKYNDPVRRKYKTGERHDPNEVNDLLERARNNTTSVKFPWINSLNQKQAEEELIIRFRSLAASLVSVCKKGKFNPKSNSHKKVLELFKTNATSYIDMANLLKISLINYSEEDLMAMAVSSICEAIHLSQKNLAATITLVFKENLKQLLEGPTKRTSLSEYADNFEGLVSDSFDDDVIFKVVIDSLPDKYWVELQEYLDGVRPKISEELKQRLIIELDLTSQN